MNICKGCGKEASKEAIYYEYENENGVGEYIFLCPDCLEGNDKIIECCCCMTYVPATTKFRFRNKPICHFCADELIKNSNNYYRKDLTDIKRLEELEKESFI